MPRISWNHFNVWIRYFWSIDLYDENQCPKTVPKSSAQKRCSKTMPIQRLGFTKRNSNELQWISMNAMKTFDTMAYIGAHCEPKANQIRPDLHLGNSDLLWLSLMIAFSVYRPNARQYYKFDAMWRHWRHWRHRRHSTTHLDAVPERLGRALDSVGASPQTAPHCRWA